MVSSVLANAILNQKAPDIVGSFREGQEYQRGEQAKKLSGRLLGGKGSQEDYAELAEINPEIAYVIGEKINARNAADINAFMRDAGVLGRMLKSGQNQAALNFAQQVARTGQMSGRDTTQVQGLIEKMQNNDWDTVSQQVNAFTGAVDQTKLTTVGKDQTVIDQYGNVVYKNTAENSDDGSLSDVAKDLVKQRNELGNTARVINTNFSKIKNLAEQVRTDKNRTSVAQLGVALVKLGDPTSVVKEDELRQAFANPNPSAALAKLVKEGKINDTGLVNSILVQLDPLNPDTVNVDDILATADALVASQLPSLQAQYGQFKELLSLRPENVQKNIFTKSFGDYFDKTLVLGNQRRTLPPQETPNTELQTIEDADLTTPELVDF